MHASGSCPWPWVKTCGGEGRRSSQQQLPLEGGRGSLAQAARIGSCSSASPGRSPQCPGALLSAVPRLPRPGHPGQGPRGEWLPACRPSGLLLQPPRPPSPGCPLPGPPRPSRAASRPVGAAASRAAPIPSRSLPPRRGCPKLSGARSRGQGGAAPRRPPPDGRCPSLTCAGAGALRGGRRCSARDRPVARP